MVLILLFCVILPLMTTAMECPKGIEVHRSCYNLSYLFALEGNFRDSNNNIIISQLGILRKNRTLYYSFTPKSEDPEYSKVGFVNLDDPTKFGVITPPINFRMNFRIFDFDQDNGNVFLGGSDGIYKLTPAIGLVSHIVSSQNRMILSLYFNDSVYFVRAREFKIQKAGTLESLFKDDDTNSEDHVRKNSVFNFVITKDNTVVFHTTEGLFAAKAELNSKVYKLSNFVSFNGLAVDLDGEVYTWYTDGIYKVILNTINPAQSMVIKVADISSFGALTFDHDNSMVFTVGRSLFRLVKSDDKQCPRNNLKINDV